MHTREEKLEAFGRFLDVLDELRVKCPWDRKQTNESLRPNTIEETYELCEALMRNNELEICKELGDVLLHIGFYAKIASEKEQFDIKDVCDKLCDKLIYRHPHVFGNTDVANSDEVENNWEQLKLKEKDGNKRVLSGVPAALPALIKAYRIQDKARHIGFDWEQKEQVWDKVREEFSELEEQIKNLNKEEMEKEFGDLFFSLINAARKYDINPENALELTNQKFIRRFNYLEDHTLKSGRQLSGMSLKRWINIGTKPRPKAYRLKEIKPSHTFIYYRIIHNILDVLSVNSIIQTIHLKTSFLWIILLRKTQWVKLEFLQTVIGVHRPNVHATILK